MEALSDDQLVTQARKVDIEAHLDFCPSCQAFLDQITLIDEEVRSLVVPELSSPSSGEFSSRLRSAIIKLEEKREMNRKIGQRLRELRTIVRQKDGDEEKGRVSRRIFIRKIEV